jgi:hypothetical protein
MGPAMPIHRQPAVGRYLVHWYAERGETLMLSTHAEECELKGDIPLAQRSQKVKRLILRTSDRRLT